MGKRKVLVVEDEIHLRIFIVTVFETAGYEVVSARNGAEGFEKAKRYLPDLISIDLMMPKEGGIHLFQQLKREETLKHIPVMVVSAISTETFAHSLELLKAMAGDSLPGPQAYVEKPPNPEVLLRTAESLLNPSG